MNFYRSSTGGGGVSKDAFAVRVGSNYYGGDMSGALAGNINLNSKIIIGRNVTNCKESLKSCSNLNQPVIIDENSVNETRFVDCSSMMEGCAKYNAPFNASNKFIINNAFRMFYQCSQLGGDIALSITNDTNLCNMFTFCSNLKGNINIQVQHGGNLNIDGSRAFMSCYNLVDNVYIPEVYNGATMFAFCNNLISVNVSVVDEASQMFENCQKFNSPVNIGENLNGATRMFMDCHVFNSPVNGTFRKMCYDAFHNCYYFNQPVNIDYPNAYNMHRMFENCYRLNQSFFVNTGPSGSRSSMFANCNGLNVPMITNGSINSQYMFDNCANLQLVKLYNVDYSRKSNFYRMFVNKNKSRLLNICLNLINTDSSHLLEMAEYMLDSGSLAWTQTSDYYYNSAWNVRVTPITQQM